MLETHDQGPGPADSLEDARAPTVLAPNGPEAEQATAPRRRGSATRERARLDRFAGALVRFLLAWAVDTVSLLLASGLLAGFALLPPPGYGLLTVAVSAALVLGIANAVLRPILVMLAMPLNALTVGFSALFINAVVLLVMAWLYPFMAVEGLLAAIGASIVLGAANAVLTGFLPLSDDDSVYQQFVERQARSERPESANLPGRGIVCMEIDGLSFFALQRALDKGLMPHVAALLESGSHVLSHVDCGLPSMTSSCQTGILFGNNADIPAFRWYEKAEGRMFASNKGEDAAHMEARLSNGEGLLVGGTSIVNNQTGDAEKSFLVFSALKPRNEAEKKLRERDMFLYTLNPYFFTRSLARTLWDFLVEIGQILRQTLFDVRPRINRLEKAYPLIRPPTTVFMRDLCTYLLTLDIQRGVPAMYATYLGYDEVAHHAGPGRRDAEMTLPGLDDQVGKLLAAIEHAPRRYDLFLLSDHGQSLGATFKDRYGETLEDLVARLAATGAVLAPADSNAGEGLTFVSAMLSELSGGRGVTGRAASGLGKAVGRRIAEREADASETLDPAGKVIVAVSGNLAHLYFDLGPRRKLTQSELESVYPGLIAALVAHPGLGLVVVHAEDGSAIVLGDDGGRNLETGEQVGTDPLLAYGHTELRARQLARLAGFGNAGDVILISSLYPDGQVAAFEELVGSHGGLGGEQTDAFLLHPADMTVPPTENAADLFPLLKARRALPGERSADEAEAWEPRETGAWRLANLWRGIAQAQLWLPRAAECLFLQREAYQAVARYRHYTGPALILAFAGTAAQGLVHDRYTGLGVMGMFGSIAAAFFVFAGWTMALHFAARALGGRGDFNATFRGQGFAQSASLLGLLGLSPLLEPIVAPLVLFLRLVAAWIGVQEAHRLRGPRTLIIPALALGVVFLVVIVSFLVTSGVAVTLEAILVGLGIEAAP